MDLGLIREISALGLGAVIAVIVLIWKRIDDQRYAATLAEMNDRLLKVVTDNTSAMNNVARALNDLHNHQERMREAIEENISVTRELSGAVTELRVEISRMSGRRQAA